MQDLIDRNERICPTAEQGFRECESKVHYIIESALSQPDTTNKREIRESIEALAVGMLWNRSWAPEFPSCDRKLLWTMLAHLFTNRNPEGAEGSERIWTVALSTAVRYAAFNLAMRRENLLKAFFPNAIRATSHAKPGQVAIPRGPGVAAWNGLGVLDIKQDGTLYVDAHPLCQIPSARFQRYSILGSSHPFSLSRSRSPLLATCRKKRILSI
jgi:hypothetical protein